ncbi:MAG: hypothetical protein ACLRSW_07130 [Christensenellaceae bacterium]
MIIGLDYFDASINPLRLGDGRAPCRRRFERMLQPYAEMNAGRKYQNYVPERKIQDDARGDVWDEYLRRWDFRDCPEVEAFERTSLQARITVIF